MPQTCTICRHAQRASIETALVHEVALRTIADQFQVSKTTLMRHKGNCMPEELAAAQAAHQEARGLDVLTQLQAANAIILGVIDQANRTTIDAAAEGLTAAEARAEWQRQQMLLLHATDRWHKQLELAATLQGKIAPAGVTVTLELAQAAVDAGQQDADAWREQRGVVRGKPRLLGAG